MPVTLWQSLTRLPAPEGGLINPKLAGQPFPAQPIRAPVSEQPLAHRLGYWAGTISQEFNDLRPVLHSWLAAVFFPVGIGFLLQFEALEKVTLEEAKLQPLLLEVPPQGLWFPCIGHWF